MVKDKGTERCTWSFKTWSLMVFSQPYYYTPNVFSPMAQNGIKISFEAYTFDILKFQSISTQTRFSEFKISQL